MHALCVWVTKEKYHSLYMCAIWYLAVRTLGLSPSSDKNIHHDSSFFLSSLSSLGRIHSQPSVSEASQVLTNALAGLACIPSAPVLPLWFLPQGKKRPSFVKVNYSEVNGISVFKVCIYVWYA